jgi:hypothetical protein
MYTNFEGELDLGSDFYNNYRQQFVFAATSDELVTIPKLQKLPWQTEMAYYLGMRGKMLQMRCEGGRQQTSNTIHKPTIQSIITGI